MQMHASDGRCVAVERMQTLAGFCVPYFERSICTTTDNDVPLHLRRPNTSRVTHQGPQALHNVNKIQNWHQMDWRDLNEFTFPVVADQTLRVLSSEPETIRLPQNWRQVMTWSSCPFNTLGWGRGLTRQFNSIFRWRMYVAYVKPGKCWLGTTKGDRGFWNKYWPSKARELLQPVFDYSTPRQSKGYS